MIAYIDGKITYRSPAYVIIDCGGIGYHINISLSTYAAIQDKETCKLHTFLHIKDDAHTLYGFSEPFEKYMFTNLISVSGVGPNTARMILSSLNPMEVQQAILSDNVTLMQSIKGIGPKSAKRLILELKDKLGKKIDEFDASMPASHNRIHEEALSALANLGFSRIASEKAISKAEQTTQNSSVEDLIKLALKHM